MFSKINRSGFGITVIILISLVAIASLFVYGHEGGKVAEEQKIDVGENLKSSSTTYITIAAIISVIIVLFSIYEKDKSEKTKIFLFLGIVIPIILATAYSAGSTIYLNLISETKGPVHWHADFEIWNCGKKIDLIDPTGLSNRVGNPILHEHGDDRVHVEGVVVKEKDVDLHTFFETIGGSLSENSLFVPTTEGYEEVTRLEHCTFSDKKAVLFPAKLQVFLYKITNPDNTKNWIYEQQKLENFEDYILSPYSRIPPGDCIIIEFDVEKNRTDKICESYKVSMENGYLRSENGS